MKANALLARTFFNSICRFIEETYLLTAICSFTNLLVFSKGEINKDINLYLSLTSLLIITGYPVFISVVNCCLDTERIFSESFKARCGGIYQDLKTRTLDKWNKYNVNSKSRLKWPLIEIVQKLILATVIVFSIKYPFA